MEIRKQFAALVIFAVPGLGGAQVVIEEPDHLKCYTIQHLEPVDPQTRIVELKNQFREETCEISLPPTRFCVETIKNQGDDPRGGAAGHFLCYNIAMSKAGIRCQQTMVAPQQALALDQFGEWPIQVRAPRQVCTPVDKVHPIPPPQ